MISKDIKNQIIKYKEEGLSNNDIAKKLNIKLSTLYYRLRIMEKEGLLERANFGSDDEILKLRAEGMTGKEIAKKFNMEEYRLTYRLRKMKESGIEIPDLPKDRRIKAFKETDIKILEMMEDGVSQVKISKKMGISQQAVSQRLQEMEKCGVNIIVNKRENKENDQILELLKDGFTRKEISNILGISCNILDNRIKKMKRAGVEIEKGKKRKTIDEKDDEILKLREQGLTEQEISLRMNLSYTTISRRLSKVRDIRESTNRNAKYINLSKEEIEKAILNLAKTKKASFEQMQTIANDYNINLSKTFYSVDMDER